MKTSNVNLMVALEEKPRGHQSRCNTVEGVEGAAGRGPVLGSVLCEW